MRRYTLSLVVLQLLLVPVAAADDRNTTRTYRTPNGELIEVGAPKALVVARFRHPDDKDVVAGGRDCNPTVEVWNYYLPQEIVTVTFTGNEVAKIQTYIKR